MAYVPLDEDFFSNPKVVANLTAAEAALYLAGLCYCQRHMTDGIIPKRFRNAFGTLAGFPRDARGLVRSGFWIDRGDHYEVHDWREWNDPAEVQKAAISRRREKDKERQRRWRERQQRAPVTVP